MKSKVCTHCLLELNLDSFSRHKAYKDGYTNQCRDCKSSYDKKRFLSKRAKIIQYQREYYRDNKDSVKKRQRAYYLSNKESYLHRSNLRDKRISMATPSWLDQDQLKDIKNFYWLAKDLSAVSGEKYHVDHIVPLKGKNVCGLHVPWNLQVLPADINLSKGNRYANDA